MRTQAGSPISCIATSTRVEDRLARLLVLRPKKPLGSVGAHGDSMDCAPQSVRRASELPFEILTHVAIVSQDEKVLTHFEMLSKECFRAARGPQLEDAWLAAAEKSAYPGALRRLGVLSKSLSPKAVCRLLTLDHRWKVTCEEKFGKAAADTLALAYGEVSYQRLYDVLGVDTKICQMESLEHFSKVFDFPESWFEAKYTWPVIAASVAEVAVVGLPTLISLASLEFSSFKLKQLREKRAQLLGI